MENSILKKMKKYEDVFKLALTLVFVLAAIGLIYCVWTTNTELAGKIALSFIITELVLFIIGSSIFKWMEM